MHPILRNHFDDLHGFIDRADKIWIFPSSKEMTTIQITHIKKELEKFSPTWHAHNALLENKTLILAKHFIFVLAHKASGCSTDHLFRFMKTLEVNYDISLLNRNIHTLWLDESICSFSLKQLQEAYKNGSVNNNSLYFDSSIATADQLVSKWAIPLEESYLYRNLI